MDPHLMYLAAAAATAAVVYVKRELVRDYVEHLVHPDGSSKPAHPSEEPTEHAAAALSALKAEAKTPYSPSSAAHVKLLTQTWTAIMQETAPPVPSRRWMEIGFQGEDPATDFRGMGLLGLRALHHVATAHHDDIIDRVVRDAADTYFYFYAIGGINIASTTLRLLESDGGVANAAFPTPDKDACMHAFLELVADSWLAFDAFFIQSINTFLQQGGERELVVMQFEVIRNSFEQQLRQRWAERVQAGEARAYIRRLVSEQ